MLKYYAQLERYEGNEALFDLIRMSMVSTIAGEPLHIHAEGLRGTGKTTIMRKAQDILPPITRIKGCIYNCDPDEPHCPDHRGLPAQKITDLGVEEIPMPFIEISHSAKVGRQACSPGSFLRRTGAFFLLMKLIVWPIPPRKSPIFCWI